MSTTHRERSVISVGELPRLLFLRAAILESAGYRVFSTTHVQEALLFVNNTDCGTLLLCYSLPPDGSRELIDEFRKRCPDGRVVVIGNTPFSETPSNVDGLIYGVEGPEALLRAVEGKAA
ncbi:MAG TPA: hypothetical protein VFA85_06000 [Terriglobales bacterium]|nr:hypothetical protein [Terriglobales bacterium]